MKKTRGCALVGREERGGETAADHWWTAEPDCLGGGVSVQVDSAGGEDQEAEGGEGGGGGERV